MGVARYKSTGDMLAAAELAGYRKKLDSEGEETETDDVVVETTNRYYCDDDDDEQKKSKRGIYDAEELARRTPLLGDKQQRRRSRTLVMNNDEDMRCGEESYRFFGGHGLWRRRDPEAEVQGNMSTGSSSSSSGGNNNSNSNNWSKHWKSAGDFLALNIQQQQQQQQVLQRKQEQEQQQPNYLTRYKERASKSAHKLHEGYSLHHHDNYVSRFDHLWLEPPKQQRLQSAKTSVSTATKRIVCTSGPGKRRRQRQRKLEGSPRKTATEPASLSLSSPALAQQHESRQKPDASCTEEAELNNANGELPQQQQQQWQQQVDKVGGGMANSRLDGLEVGKLKTTMTTTTTTATGNNGADLKLELEAFNVDARGTMELESPMDQNYREPFYSQHCFVDVAHLQQQQQHQSHLIPDLPEPNQLTNERSTVAITPTTNTTADSGEAECCLDKTKNLSRQDNSISSNKQQLQQHDYDNGTGLLEGRGVGFNEAGAEVGDTKAGAVVVHGNYCGSGCHECNGSACTGDAGQVTRVSAGKTAIECAQSASAANYSSTVVMLPNSRQDNKSAAATAVGGSFRESDIDYAPTQQQQANQLHRIQQQQQGLLVRENKRLIERQQPQQEAGGTNGQVLVVATTTTTKEKLVRELGNSGSLVNSPNISTATNGLMGSCCESWRHALQPNKSGIYKVAQNQQQQVAPISGSNSRQLNAATPTSLAAATTSTRESFQQQQQQETNSHQQANFCPQTNFNNFGGQERRATTASNGRHSRPGRSPITLQRLTNGRLARHRLKIQQQRQEQLAQLAIRERQQLRQFTHQANHHHHQRQHYLNHQDHQQQQQQDSLAGISSIFLVNGLIDRFSSTTTGQRYQQQQQNSNRTPGELSTSLAHDQRQQQSVITPNTTNRTIEICDNQLASSSRSNSSRGSGSTHSQYHQSQRLGGNVIVYKSINMLRNTPLDNHSSAYGRQHNLASYSGDTNRRSYQLQDSVDSEEIESDPDTNTISSEGSSMNLNKPFCKVCHTGSTKHGDKLISPCKCSGTMQYIHCGCLLKWLEISNRSNEKPMSCELCAHEYTWHKKFNYKQMRLPKCSIKDAFLHVIFVAAMAVMLFSAVAPMLQRKSQELNTSTPNMGQLKTQPPGSFSVEQHASNSQNRQQQQASNLYATTTSSHRTKHSTGGHLAQDEKFMLLCAASFFMSFFLAIYVQTKARDTLYGLVVKFLTMNQTYYITEYDHGQLNGQSNSNTNNNVNSSGSKQQQQQQYGEDGSQGFDRKHSSQKS